MNRKTKHKGNKNPEDLTNNTNKLELLSIEFYTNNS